jgi:hypothetical protein
MWKAVAIGGAMLGIQACSQSIRPVESVLAEVQRDEVAAAVTMRGEDVGLEGLVNHKGLKTEREFALKYGWGTGVANEVQRNVGYVELGSTSGARSGYALCLFESGALDWLATVQEGQTVRLTCRFANVEGHRSARYPVFRNCWGQY